MALAGEPQNHVRTPPADSTQLSTAECVAELDYIHGDNDRHAECVAEDGGEEDRAVDLGLLDPGSFGAPTPDRPSAALTGDTELAAELL